MSFYGVTDLWTYVLGAFGIILLPGPNSLYVLSVATARGVRAGYQGAVGVFLGDTILLLLTALGAASLLRSNPSFFLVVKYLGAAYLAWVGVNLIWAAIQKLRSAQPVASLMAEAPVNMQEPFLTSLAPWRAICRQDLLSSSIIMRTSFKSIFFICWTGCFRYL